jgi:hypothetical protein
MTRMPVFVRRCTHILLPGKVLEKTPRRVIQICLREISQRASRIFLLKSKCNTAQNLNYAYVFCFLFFNHEVELHLTQTSHLLVKCAFLFLFSKTLSSSIKSTIYSYFSTSSIRSVIFPPFCRQRCYSCTLFCARQLSRQRGQGYQITVLSFLYVLTTHYSLTLYE